MRIVKTCLFLFAALLVTRFAEAQKKPAPKSAVTTFQKIKPPRLQTFLDSYKDSVAVTVAIAESIVGLPLKIYDDKKNEYGISSYQFLYTKRVVSEDAEGNPVPATSMSSDRFRITPLPELWINLIKQQVKKGEEFFFFDVIVKDSKGRVMYAPNLKIVIQ